MRLWVFSNADYGFGYDVCLAAVTYCRLHGIEYCVVFSPKYPRPSAGVVAGWRRRVANGMYRWRVLRRLPFLPEVIEDVNASALATRIQADDIGLIAGFNQIFRKTLIDRFRVLLNVHPSVLPLYRGPVPSRWCLANGETCTGYTLHHVTERIDAGEIVYQEALDIPPGATEAEVDSALSRLAASRTAEQISVLVDNRPVQRHVLDAAKIYKIPVHYASLTGTPDVHAGKRRATPGRAD